MPKLVKKITVEATPGGGARVFVDGQEFPWYIAREDLDLRYSPEGLHSITLQVLCEDLELITK
jgi:hypothetical protein